MTPSRATRLLGCPIGTVLVAVLLGGVHVPMLFAETAILLSQVDQPFASFLWNLGLDQLHLPFCIVPFHLAITRGLVINNFHHDILKNQ